MLENVPSTPLGDMFREHIRLLLAKDIEGLLDQYSPTGILISSIEKVPKVFRGREELREHFQAILAIEDLVDHVGFWGEFDGAETGHADGLAGLMITEGIEMTVGGQKMGMRFADSWVLRNGLIEIHFAGMVQFSDGSLS